MSASGYLESLLNNLPADIRPPMVNFVRYAFKNIRLGEPPDDSGAAPAENFPGAIVRFTSSSVANQENAVAHQLAWAPRKLIPMLDLGTVNATIPVLTVTRAADTNRFYVKTPSVSTECLVYVE